jgi:glycosyltransferase involved in cell wall biosynthesis
VHLAGAFVTHDGISVIIPAYNVESFIGETIASVVAQTWPVQEILVIDDGSTDGTAAWLSAMAGQDGRLRVLTADRLGPGGARNVGLKAATCPIIAFLDGDDVWPPQKIARQMDRLAAADRPDVVSGLIQRFRNLAPGTLTPAGAPGEIMAHVNLGACLFRRQVFEVVGLLDERLRNSEDVDLTFRVREAGLKLVIMREVALYYRIRPGSLTQTQLTQGQQNVDTLKALRLSIGRRRKSGGALDLPPFTSLIE